MYVEDHGGGCCGIMHIAGFGSCNDGQLRHLDNLMGDYIPDNYYNSKDYDTGEQKPSFNIMLEAVLTDQQMQDWWKDMKLRGFRVVNRFKNSNSGNYCNVLHYCPHEPRGKSRKPRPY